MEDFHKKVQKILAFTIRAEIIDSLFVAWFTSDECDEEKLDLWIKVEDSILNYNGKETEEN